MVQPMAAARVTVNFQHAGKPVIDLSNVRLIYLGDDPRTAVQ